MTKILFVHNTAMWYRRPFFKRVSELYDVKFIFTDIQESKEVYGVELSENIEGLEGVRYKSLNNYFGVTFGILKELGGDYDIIIKTLEPNIETMLSFTIAKLRRKHIIVWTETWGWRDKAIKRKLYSLYCKSLVTHCDAILVPGSKHKEYIVSLGASPDRVFIMPNASNISVKEEDYINNEKLKDKYNIGAKKVVLYIGRLVVRKGVDYLIKAFATLRNEREDVVLIIIGRGECRDELESLAKDLDIEGSICFMGYVEDEQLPAYYLICDVFVVPSITYGIADPWALTVNEAMYFGKPVIATDAVGAAFDMIKGGVNGFVVPEKDAAALYKAMKKILSDPELEKKMGGKSKRIIEQGFTYENMIDVFRKAIESRQGA